MSLPPALLQRLAQRGLVQKGSGTAKDDGESRKKSTPAIVENEEVIAEDYDEMEEPEHPSSYESSDVVKRPEENFWLERMKLRIGEAGSYAGHKGCPNKYNIYHKCTLFCVNRWAEGHTEPTRDYIKRYKRLLQRYPLPKGWTEMYDPGCGCFYFWNMADSSVSWLPPTHPKSEITKCAATYRRQLEEASTGTGNGGGSTDDEVQTDDDNTHDDHNNMQMNESENTKHHREIEQFIRQSMRARSPPVAAQDLHETQPPPRKQKSRDLEKTLSRQRRERERDRERMDRGGGGERERHGYARGRRHGGGRGAESEALDPMDPSAYSDIPRGKWSDGLNVGGGEERNKKTEKKTAAGGGARSGGDFSDDANQDEQAEDYN